MKIEFGDTSVKAKLGDTVSLQSARLQNLEVVECQKTGVPMLNIDADQLRLGDLRFIKKLGLTISNPETTDPVALGVDYVKETFGEKLSSFFDDDEDEDEDDDDDSSFFSGVAAGAAVGGFLGSMSGGGGFGGGSSFGGFGGGSFNGGGASGSF